MIRWHNLFRLMGNLPSRQGETSAEDDRWAAIMISIRVSPGEDLECIASDLQDRMSFLGVRVWPQSLALALGLRVWL